MRAWLNLRYTDDKRASLFSQGLSSLGYKVEKGMPHDPGSEDIFVTWNRIGAANNVAKMFEKRGLRVLVAENASWGNSFAGHKWYHIANNYHNTADRFIEYDFFRFARLGVELSDWRTSGEVVILPQRGIGSDPVRMPGWFVKTAQKEHGGRVRKHPGLRDHNALEEDLKDCGKVITWGSGAAIKALMMGIPVVSYYEDWIGKQDNTDRGRLDMFRRLSWAQWTHEEIKSGYAFERLLRWGT